MPARDECVLRAMRADDLALVREWRNDAHVRCRMFSTHEILADEHLQWWSRASVDPRQRHFVFEVCGRPVGVSNLNLEADGSAEWGFYIGPEDAPRGSGGAMGWLVLDYAFRTLGLPVVTCRVLASNHPSARLLERLGFGRVRVEPEYAVRDDGTAEDVTIFERRASDWAHDADRLADECFRR